MTDVFLKERKDERKNSSNDNPLLIQRREAQASHMENKKGGI
jgi:hypothetical protein